MDKFAYMRLAMEEARKSAEEGEVPVGAIIVRDGEIIATGRNRRETGRNALFHAETEAIRDACRTLGGWRLPRCELYVTLEPCPMCAGAIINSRIEKVYFGAYDAKAGSAGSVTDLFALPYNHRPECEGGVLEEECAQQLSDFFRTLRNSGRRNRKNIKAVLIDVDNTLLDFQKCAEESIRLAFLEWGLPYDENVFPTFERINNGLWERIEEKTLTIDELHKIRWGLIFAELGIVSDGEAFEWAFVNNLDESCVPVDGANELLPYLASKYVLCAASNAPYEQQRYRLEKAGMLPYFTHLFISEEIGHPKPTKEFFDCCMERLGGITKEETAMIGDSLSADIDGGSEYGLFTVWYNHKRQPVPENVRADKTVSRLTDVKYHL